MRAESAEASVAEAAEAVRTAEAEANRATEAAAEDYWKRVHALFTRDVTGRGLRELIETDAQETLRFFARAVETEDLDQRPWFQRWPIAAFRLFEATAYRLSPARRMLFSIAVTVLLFAWLQYFLQAFTRGWTYSWSSVSMLGCATLLFVLLVFELRDKLTLKGDLEVARQIQFGLLPFEPWERAGFTACSAMRPANTVGGDYFDIVELGEGRVAVVMGDVAGKGMPAALLMALLQGSLRTLLTAGLRSCEVMAKLNAHLFANIPSNRLVTLFYGELDPVTGRLLYVNAGHNPPLLVRGSGAIERLTATAVALGVVSETPFEAGEVDFAPGDRLLLYTDGVTEAENALEEEFGEGRLTRFLDAHRADTDRGLLDGVLANVLLHGQGVKPRDDMTLMVLGRH